LAAVVGGALLAWLAPVGAAQAQVAADLGVQSDYRLRGLTTTDGKPAVVADLSYDHASGAYAGVTGLAAALPGTPGGALGYIAYAGYAFGGRSGPTWDVGVVDAGFDDLRRYGRTYGYVEVYGGFTAGPLAARLYYSPDYLGEGLSTLYADLAATWRPARAWRLFAHAGVLTPLEGSGPPYSFRERYDISLGAARRFGRFELQVEGTWTAPDPAYGRYDARKRDGLLVSVRRYF
jgi:uncharacterized protein (TIGR02001 family)